MAPHSSTLAWRIPWMRSLVGCSPWGRRESYTTERLYFHFSLSCIWEGNGNPLQYSCLENPMDEEPGGLQSMGSQRVRHDWAISLSSHPYMTTGKTIALTRWTFVSKVMSLLFNMLSRLVITFLSRSKCVLISWLKSPSAVILEPPKIKSATVSTVCPSICHEMMGRLPWS